MENPASVRLLAALRTSSGIYSFDSTPDVVFPDVVSLSMTVGENQIGMRTFIEWNSNVYDIFGRDLNLKNNGEFSTLLIAGGQGWENGGKYFLNVEYGDFSNSISFNFNAK